MNIKKITNINKKWMLYNNSHQNNEICYSENNSICFYDIFERKIRAKISNIKEYNDTLEWFTMTKKDLLFIPGSNQLFVINTNEYKLVRKIEVPNSSSNTGVCLLNKNILLTGDYESIIRQWKIEEDNLVLISKKEKTHESYIYFLLNMGRLSAS